VNALLFGIDSLVAALKVGFLGAAIVITVVATVDWAVRTRRINPFNGVARFFRSSVDPLIAPVERRVVRAGGVPSNAPWWALVALILAGIIVISLLGFVRGQLYLLAVASGMGPRGLAHVLVQWTFAILQLALIVRVVISWIRVSPYSRWVRWSFVLTEWLLRPLRQIVPTIGMIDITPIIAYFALQLLEGLIVGMI
jgi:YggT family protein